MKVTAPLATETFLPVRDMASPADEQGLALSVAKESQQVGVNAVLQGRSETMRCAGVIDRLGVLHQSHDLFCRIVNRHDLIVLAVHEQCRHVDPLQVFGEIGLGKSFDAFIGIFLAALHTPQPELIQQSLRDLGAIAVGAIERNGQLFVELRSIAGHALANAVENLYRQAFGIASRLD